MVYSGLVRWELLGRLPIKEVEELVVVLLELLSRIIVQFRLQRSLDVLETCGEGLGCIRLVTSRGLSYPLDQCTKNAGHLLRDLQLRSLGATVLTDNKSGGSQKSIPTLKGRLLPSRHPSKVDRA